MITICIFNYYMYDYMHICKNTREFCTWTSPDDQYWNQIDYVLCSQIWRSSEQLAKTRLGGDCDSDHELLIDKFGFKLKKEGKTTGTFTYDLNQIPYEYTMEVTNRFKGLDLIECLKNYRWRFITLYRWLWSKPSPRRRNAKSQNGYLSLTNSWVKERSKRQRREVMIYLSGCRVPKNNKER